ncbi:MAG: transcriptional repressor [Planctomycetota bacterium]
MELRPIQPAADAPEDTAEELDIIEPLCAVFRRSLKGEGLKYTPERARILDAIIELDALFEADQLLEHLRRADFRVSKATVYRTLKLLEDAGIVQRVLFDREQSHYQLAYGKGANTLLVHVDTGEVEAIDLPELLELRDRVCRERGLIPEGHRLQIFVAAPSE